MTGRPAEVKYIIKLTLELIFNNKTNKENIE